MRSTLHAPIDPATRGLNGYQYSIYRARLDNIQLEHLRCDLSHAMAAEDSLLIVDLCPSCATNVISRNHVAGWEEPVSSFRVVGGAAVSAMQGSPDVADDETPDLHNHQEDEGDPAD